MSRLDSLKARLTAIDERWLPAAALWVQSVDARLGASMARARGARTRVSTAGRHGLRAAPKRAAAGLVAADERWARTGPLALVREIPQLGALVIAVTLLVNGAVVAQRQSPTPLSVDAPIPTAGPDEPAGEALIGPAIGDRVDEYVADARARLAQRVAAGPDRQQVAVISFATGQTPAQAETLLRGVGVFRVVFRVDAGKAQTTLDQSPVKRVAEDSLTAFKRVAAGKRLEIPEFKNLAATTDDPAFKEFYVETARVFELEAAALERGCPCIVGAAVIASAQALDGIAGKPEVRLVDVGPTPFRVDLLTYRPLLPTEKSVITGGNEAG